MPCHVVKAPERRILILIDMGLNTLIFRKIIGKNDFMENFSIMLVSKPKFFVGKKPTDESKEKTIKLVQGFFLKYFWAPVVQKLSGLSSPHFTQQIGARVRFKKCFGPSRPQAARGYPAITSLKIFWRSIAIEYFFGPNGPETTKGYPALTSQKKIGARCRSKIFLGPSSPERTQGYPALTSLTFSWLTFFAPSGPETTQGLSSPHFTKKKTARDFVLFFWGQVILK